MSLPKWIVQMRTTHHTSTRQPARKRPDWIKEYYRTLHQQQGPRIRAGIVHGPGTSVVITKLTPAGTGPLDLNEYRFWRAHEGKGRCRACMDVVATTKERIEHQKTKGCTRTLVEAYKLLLRDRMCVVCDRKTEHTKWGVPMCSNACLFRWQFEVGAGNYAIAIAIRLHETQSGGAKL